LGLTAVPAGLVDPPLIRECFANLECTVVDTRFVRKYNLFMLEVINAWITPSMRHAKTLHHQGFGRFVVDGEIIKVKSRMR
jgi:flavin reductase (DIM6/NTAB) family NADH-FMN oxidoreductase RutF